jgi:hypothetical protein
MMDLNGYLMARKRSVGVSIWYQNPSKWPESAGVPTRVTQSPGRSKSLRQVVATDN